MMTDIDFIFFDAGGGHRAAATALKSVIDGQNAQQNREWNVRLVNLQEILHELDVFRKVTGVRLEDLYNQALARGWTQSPRAPAFSRRSRSPTWTGLPRSDRT